jgi:hypothetical protein
MTEQTRKLTPAEKFGKMKRTEGDKDLSQSERKNTYKDWHEEQNKARQKDQRFAL